MTFLLNIRSVLRASLIVGGFAATLGSVSVSAESEYEEQVRRYLDRATSIASENGFTSTHHRQSGQLNEGGTRSVTLALDRGVEYMIVGQCDNDCSDIDMWLYDQNGNEVDSDTQADDSPILRVTPVRSARFRYQIRMHSCSEEPCYYGIGVFGR